MYVFKHDLIFKEKKRKKERKGKELSFIVMRRWLIDFYS